MTCPYLEYRESNGEQTFSTGRAYCGVVDRFVQPMRADVCNDRFDLRHDGDCEHFRATQAEGNGERTGTDGSSSTEDRS